MKDVRSTMPVSVNALIKLGESALKSSSRPHKANRRWIGGEELDRKFSSVCSLNRGTGSRSLWRKGNLLVLGDWGGGGGPVYSSFSVMSQDEVSGSGLCRILEVRGIWSHCPKRVGVHVV